MNEVRVAYALGGTVTAIVWIKSAAETFVVALVVCPRVNDPAATFWFFPSTSVYSSLSDWIDGFTFVLANVLTTAFSMCAVRSSRPFFQLTAVSASDHLSAFSMCRDSGICMATLLPYASSSSRILLMDCVCLCVRALLHVFGVLDGGIRDGSSKRTYHRLCAYMRAFTLYGIMEDINGLVFHHTVHIRRLLGPVLLFRRNVLLHLALDGMVGHTGPVIKRTPPPMILLVQFNGNLLIYVVGSKIENRFLIVFNLFC